MSEPTPKVIPQRRSTWRWAAPAGAIAAGLLVFAVVTEMRHSEPLPPPTAEIAAKQKPSGATPSEPQTDRTSEIAKEAQNAAKAAPAMQKPAAPLVSQMAKGKVQRAGTPSEAGNRDELGRNALDLRSNETRQAQVQAGPELKDEVARKKALAGITNGPAPKTVQEQMSDQQKQAVAAEAAPVPPPPAPEAEDTRDDKTQESAPTNGRAAFTQIQRVAPTQESELARANRIVSPQVIASPDHQSLWRVGANGAISYSSDQGAHWDAQSSGIAAELTAGSAPTAKICWVVGKQGTILRTDTGGRAWLKVASPISGDLGGVQATDALHARIWDIERKASFETSDGGKTWEPVSGQ